MKKFSLNSIFLIIIIACLCASFMGGSQFWIIGPMLILFTPYLWFKSKDNQDLLIPLFFCNLISTITVWFSYPWIGIIILISAVGLLLSQIRDLVINDNLKNFLILSGIIGLIGGIVIQMNDITNFFVIFIIVSLLSSVIIYFFEYYVSTLYMEM